jgi:hypothetical protein
MFRTMVLVLAWGCGGRSDDGDDGDDGDDDEPPPILSTVAGDYDVDVEVIDDTCDNDVSDVFDDFTIRLSQVSTGLSALVDLDVGWVPCEGSVDAFVCAWGNAPTDSDDSLWSWTLEGVATAQEVQATLSLVVTCEGGGGGGGGGCEPCTIVADYTGPFDRP